MPTVLIADAAAALRRMLRSILEVRDYAVIEAESGEHAMDSLYQQTESTIVLLDSALTVAGKSVVETLSATAHLIDRHTFIIMHTRFDHPTISHFPAAFHLEKPFTVDALQHAITLAGALLA